MPILTFAIAPGPGATGTRALESAAISNVVTTTPLRMI